MIVLMVALLAPPDGGVAARPAVASNAQVLELGRTFTAWFYAGDVDKLWERMAPPMRSSFKTPQAIRQFLKLVEADAGREARVIEELGIRLDGLHSYRRRAAFARVPEVDVLWAFGADGIITGFYVKPPAPPAPSRHLGHQTKTVLRLPFTGEWFVFWGGRTVALNYHAQTPDQRFAYDLLVARDGRTFDGDGKRNEQYYAFGLPILAPAAGRVVAVVDGIADNVPGAQNPKQPVGNHVVIDHGNGEFSFLAHLANGSVRVKKGARVKAGDPIGKCGNSGNSSQAHLHYHLQTTPVFGEGVREEGLPAPFVDYIADGEPVARGEPTRGQIVRPR